jgi:hypothetical protein
MSDKQQTLILKETIAELRRRYDFINDMYEGARFKTLTFLGAGFALLSYLYANSSEEGLFIPSETYGKIFYGLAIVLIIGAMVMLLLSIKGSRWEFPCHEVKLGDIEDKENHLSFLRYVRDEYLRSTNLNLYTYENKYRVLNISLLMLLVGGILVVLMKVFGKQ